MDRIGLPPSLLAALKHVASLHNPDFYEKERNRFWTGNTPRFIRCYRETLDQLLLPRGRPSASGSDRDRGRVVGSSIMTTSRVDRCGRVRAVRALLRPDQQTAVEALPPHELGVLVAPPGAGKTVIACASSPTTVCPTLVIVDRQPLVEQWRDRLGAPPRSDKRQVGQIGSKRRQAVWSTSRWPRVLPARGDLAELTERYGLVVVDECHHVPAVTFERAVRQIPVQTMARSDGDAISA